MAQHAGCAGDEDSHGAHRISISRVVADHELVGLGLAVAAGDVDVAAQQRGLHAPVEAVDARAGEQDRVLDLGALHRAVLADRRVGPDVAVGQHRARADDGGPADGRALQLGARLDDDAPLDLGVDQLALDPMLHAVEDQPVGLQHVVQAPGVLPPALDDVRLDAAVSVDQVLDRVGDLQLAARRGLDRARRVVDQGHEHVDADEREVRLGLRRLLGQGDDAVAVELGDAEVLGVGHRRQEDQRIGLVGLEGGDEVVDAALQQVVAQVHDERRVAQERLGGQDRVGQAGGLVLQDVGDLDAEGRAVAGDLLDLLARLGGDDDPDLLDARLGHRVDAVEEHRAVGDRHQLLGAGVGDRAQARALAPGENQALERLHQ